MRKSLLGALLASFCILALLPGTAASAEKVSAASNETPMVSVFSNGGYPPFGYPERNRWRLAVYQDGTVIAEDSYSGRYKYGKVKAKQAKKIATQLAKALQHDDWGYGNIMDAETTHIAVSGKRGGAASIYALGIDQSAGITKQQARARERVEKSLDKLYLIAQDGEDYDPQSYTMHVTLAIENDGERPQWTGPSWAGCQVIGPEQLSEFPAGFTSGTVYVNEKGQLGAVWVFPLLPGVGSC